LEGLAWERTGRELRGNVNLSNSFGFQPGLKKGLTLGTDWKGPFLGYNRGGLIGEEKAFPGFIPPKEGP